jgi:translation initiation factor 1
MTRLFSGTPWDRPPKCDRCGELIEECGCAPETPPRIPPEQQLAKLAIEKRQRGKTVTVVRGLATEGNDLPALLVDLKNACASGGTLKDDTLEVQGSHLDRVRKLLEKLGYKTRG